MRTKQGDVRNQIEPRLFSEGPNSTLLLRLPRPLSLSMGPVVIEKNADGDEEAAAMTDAWRPVFKVIIVTKRPESRDWQS